MGNQSDKALRVLVAMPLFCYWIFGSVNLFAGYLVQRRKFGMPTPAPIQSHTNTSPQSLNNIHHHHNNNNNNITNKLNNQNNVNGMGAFLFIYCIPSGLLIIAVFYEFANRDIWLNDPQPSYEPMSGTKAPMWPFILRAFMEILVGVLASGWTLAPRFSTIWKSKFGVNITTAAATKVKQTPIKYPQPAYSCTASYQTVCPQNSMVSIAKIPSHGRKYPPAHVYRKSRTYKSSSQSISLTGNETVL